MAVKNLASYNKKKVVIKLNYKVQTKSQEKQRSENTEPEMALTL